MRLANFSRRLTTIRAELVSPNKARQYLRNQAHNRKPDPKRIRKYANRMGRGEWHLGSALEFNKRGKLFNGQSRLLAVMRSALRSSASLSRRTVPFLTVRGVQE